MADGNSRSDLPLDGSCPGTFSSVVQKLFQPFSAFHQSHAAVGSLSRDLPLPPSSSFNLQLRQAAPCTPPCTPIRTPLPQPSLVPTFLSHEIPFNPLSEPPS